MAYIAEGVGPKAVTSLDQLPKVDDPEKTYSDITRNEYLDFLKNYDQFEQDMVNRSQTDTSLIDQAKVDAEMSPRIAEGIAARNAQRYGVGLTAAQREAQRRNIQLGGTLAGIQGVADARLAQREANQTLLSDLINIGQGVNRASQSQMGSAAQDANMRKTAYNRAKAQSKMDTYSTIGNLGSLAILSMVL